MQIDWARFCEDYDVAVACLSRDRADVLAKDTDRLIGGYHLFHCGEGYGEHEYRGCIARQAVPPGLAGLSAVRNYVLRQLDQRIVVFVDDDFKRIGYTHAADYAYLGPIEMQLVIINLVVNALDVGANVFGISEFDIRTASPLNPFRFRAVVGGLIGVIGRGLWFDERNKLKVDYDFCLQAMSRDRVILKDHRYWLNQDRNILPGGNMRFRTREREEAEIENLVKWWGSDVIGVTRKKKVIGLSVRV